MIILNFKHIFNRAEANINVVKKITLKCSHSDTLYFSIFSVMYSPFWRRTPWSAPNTLYQTTPRTSSVWSRTLMHVLSSSCVHWMTLNLYGKDTMISINLSIYLSNLSIYPFVHLSMKNLLRPICHIIILQTSKWFQLESPPKFDGMFYIKRFSSTKASNVTINKINIQATVFF